MKEFNVKGLNDELMPIANDIKAKMDNLQDRFNFKLDFGFPEITMEEIIGKNENLNKSKK